VATHIRDRHTNQSYSEKETTTETYIILKEKAYMLDLFLLSKTT
jgi:hypothetical protein